MENAHKVMNLKKFNGEIPKQLFPFLSCSNLTSNQAISIIECTLPPLPFPNSHSQLALLYAASATNATHAGVTQKWVKL